MDNIFQFQQRDIWDSYYELSKATVLGSDDSIDSDIDQKNTKSKSPSQIDPYVTSYVCLMAPRFEEHLLLGDISSQLHTWMKDLCISYGWQLKFIDVKPEYLHWIMTVSITTYPNQFMKIVLRETSKKVFDDFPRFKVKNVSNQFWAPWYFVGVGEAPYSKNSIQSFIKQIRMEQGL